MKSLLSTFLLLFFLMGQVNLTWAKHFCGDELVSSKVTLAAEGHDCCESEKGSKVPMDCCEDEISTADSDDFFGKTEFQVKISPEFILAYALVFGFPPAEKQTAEKPDFEFPDKPIPDLNILHQTFLI
jgi:hypothetical protein